MSGHATQPPILFLAPYKSIFEFSDVHFTPSISIIFFLLVFLEINVLFFKRNRLTLRKVIKLKYESIDRWAQPPDAHCL